VGSLAVVRAVVASELTLGATAYEGRGRGGRAVTQVGNSGSATVEGSPAHAIPKLQVASSICNTSGAKGDSSHPRRSSDGSTGARASASRSNVCWMMALSEPSEINVSADAQSDPIQTLKPWKP